MKIKINTLHFQRNGGRGEPFYHCFATVTDDKKREMIITFKANNDDNSVDIESCRAVCPSEPKKAWSGDEIGYALNDELKKLMADADGTIYGCISKIK